MGRVLALWCTALVSLALTRDARADEMTPELEGLELRQKAQAELRKLQGTLVQKDERRLAGLYLAFEPSASDPLALAACDDDGDYVIVLSDAMLRLVSVVARAQSYDEANGSRSIEDYAAFLGRSQIPGRRLLPPPPGFYSAQKSGTTMETRLREALAFVIGRELAHLRSGDLVCPHPTATHESGDDEWTPAEQRKALEGAASLYPGRQTERDTEGMIRALEAGRAEDGALGLMRFFAQLETERIVHVSRFQPTYLTHHPSPSTRASAIRAAVTQHKDAATGK
ncbi:MAG: hypothetical protein KF819_12845 [Labilithrix sp.]|nr:hypothetical protein [Labilithrix sp.]